MRIGIEARWLQRETTGFGKYAFNLLRGFSRIEHKHEFSIYVGAACNERELFNDSRVREVVLSLRPPLYKQVGIPLDMLWHRRHFDLFHFLYNSPSVFTPCPFVLTVHDLSYLHVPEMLSLVDRTLMWCQLKLKAQKARRIITDSENSKRDIMERLRVAESRIDVIPLGLEDAFRPTDPDKKAALCRRYGLQRPFLLYVGTYLPHKNIETLIKAFKRLLAKEQYPLELVLAGKKGRNADKIEQLTKTLGLEHCVRMLGFVPDEDLPLLYGTCRAFVYPSLYEGFGLPMLEAMACGVPVVAARSSCLPEVGGDAALYFEPMSVEKLAGVLEVVLKDECLREKCVRRGIERAAGFSWQTVAERTLGVYERAVACVAP